jgi:hypothetical protein
MGVLVQLYFRNLTTAIFLRKRFALVCLPLRGFLGAGPLRGLGLVLARYILYEEHSVSQQRLCTD